MRFGFEKDGSSEDGSPFVEHHADRSPVSDRVVGQVDEQGARRRGSLPEAADASAGAVEQFVGCGRVPYRLALRIRETHDDLFSGIGDRRAHAFRAHAAYRQVAPEEERRIEVEHPARIRPKGILAGGERIGQRKSVREPKRIALDLPGRDDLPEPVGQIDVEEVRERIGSVEHRVCQIGLEPNGVARSVVGLVQVKEKFLRTTDRLRIEKSLYSVLDRNDGHIRFRDRGNDPPGNRRNESNGHRHKNR